MTQTVLVTGGAGFIGSNLADRLASEGHRVRIYDALMRPGVDRNLEWLIERHGDKIEPVLADVREPEKLAAAVEGVDAAFHFAAQVAVTTSMVDPASDLAININGTFNLLEAARAQPKPVPVIFASTNKVYGDLVQFGSHLTAQGHYPEDAELAKQGVSEAQPLDFHTPYGVSKGAADQYVLDYARSYDLPTAVVRMSCVYGERQMGTEDQGWVAHFLIQALQGNPITLYGDGHQVRDVLYVGDAVEAYLAAWRQIDKVKGQVFNLGGGPANAVSLRNLLDTMAETLGCRLDVRSSDWRPGDQRWFVADTRKIDATLGLPEKLGWRSGVARLAEWLAAERGIDLPAQPAPLATAGAH
ncbi:SDR family NAD(P)-dependent oxidoreductase [Novosphingobium sp. 9U]|uniref:SDR family NAD(P)-dependent oxidoreductase n=1 Tax=Novosphingobium sp. 9U TaxID=2653158 RepID=UPI0012F0C162|nr:SDR family NAD(P)-dependent oxidoreductase [Novosphingobium sp. 9U]VWX55016.1 CDP-paratose 2-epimerase [Novosphingobium sp. 9U]